LLRRIVRRDLPDDKVLGIACQTALLERGRAERKLIEAAVVSIPRRVEGVSKEIEGVVIYSCVGLTDSRDLDQHKVLVGGGGHAAVRFVENRPHRLFGFRRDKGDSADVDPDRRLGRPLTAPARSSC